MRDLATAPNSAEQFAILFAMGGGGPEPDFPFRFCRHPLRGSGDGPHPLVDGPG
jgi:hypothetical protein